MDPVIVIAPSTPCLPLSFSCLMTIMILTPDETKQLLYIVVPLMDIMIHHEWRMVAKLT